MSCANNAEPGGSPAAANLWRHTLSQIGSTFGRIFYLASLRNLNTGLYEHFGLAQRFTPAEADDVIHISHVEVFHQWLSLGLQHQKLDLEDYLSTLDAEVAPVIAAWVRLKPYQTVLPEGTRTVERELFLADLERILEILKFEHAVSAPDPDA
jgi:hypothetical protein